MNSRSTVIDVLRTAGCVFAEDEADLLISTATTPAALTAMIDRRVEGVPLEQIVGWALFRELRVSLDPGVFVPRRRSEFLVEEALKLVPRPAVVVDLCCGSGALGIALAAASDDVELVAADVEPAAVRCARRNVEAVGGRVFEGDLFEPLPTDLKGRVDVLLANVPYVPSEAVALMPPEARLHEPRVALDGGVDGLDVLRRVAAEAAAWLADGGHLLVETSDRQAAEAVAVMTVNGLTAWSTYDDDRGATVVIGKR
ncbi:putative protein N(5)-glutamine methyltransferase [Kribbella sp. NBC_01245]|uniref:putative protein N(5)-glutamine methyltransferase n=1 Tax=Kribbella sp. NBC_01245 TaxID=2903578 RepID=UPI002E29367F|nr:putative protein N(5)-glutamine methyltransferase [Kribbella sp. NBC_01245]